MHSTIAIDVAAPPSLLFRLARDVERWERLLPHYARSRARERRVDGSLVVDFVARRPLIGVLGLSLPVAWRARTWNEPASLRLRFAHVAGATKGMDVTWRIEGLGPDLEGSRVSIDHDFRPRLPLLAAVVDRAFTRPIAGRTLATFKALAEALAEGEASTGAAEGTAAAEDTAAIAAPDAPRQSEPPGAANPPP
jgi:ribosome-associated toxin RatA of RatAB toxin-antitoxin module